MVMVQLLYRCSSQSAPVASVKEYYFQLNVIKVYFPVESKCTSYLNFKVHLERFEVEGSLIGAVFQNSVSAEDDKLTFMSAIAVLQCLGVHVCYLYRLHRIGFRPDVTG